MANNLKYYDNIPIRKIGNKFYHLKSEVQISKSLMALLAGKKEGESIMVKQSEVKYITNEKNNYQ